MTSDWIGSPILRPLRTIWQRRWHCGTTAISSVNTTLIWVMGVDFFSRSFATHRDAYWIWERRAVVLHHGREEEMDEGGIREVLAAELLEALGVQTCRIMSLVETGESLVRHDEESPTRSAVMVRLSWSNIRVGTFQRLAVLGHTDVIRRLVDYVLEHYFVNLNETASEERAAVMLREVARRCLRTCARWMTSGFVHGVLNTDNFNVTGESFDYGPWRFVPTWDRHFVAAYFDYQSRYAFGRQVDATMWTLARLAECLLEISPKEPLQAVLDEVAAVWREERAQAFARRLGVASECPAMTAWLADQCEDFLVSSSVPVAQFFHDWWGGATDANANRRSPCRDQYCGPVFDRFRATLSSFSPVSDPTPDSEFLAQVSPPTLLNDEVIQIWRAIADKDNWEPFHAKIQEIRKMGTALQLC